MLIDNFGEKKGVMSIEKALEAAKELSLDLVQVSPPGAEVIVCKILDYGKHLFDKKKIVQPQELKLKEIPSRR